MSDTNGDLGYSWFAKQEQAKAVEVPLKDVGHSVWMRKLSAGEYYDLFETDDDAKRRLISVARSLCNRDGSPIFDNPIMFTSDHAEQVMRKQDPHIFSELLESFNRIHGLVPIEDLAKNSPGTETGPSPTGSPDHSV